MSVQTFAQWKSYYPDGTTRKNTKKEQKTTLKKIITNSNLTLIFTMLSALNPWKILKRH